jgi:hypothetical protein
MEETNYELEKCEGKVEKQNQNVDFKLKSFPFVKIKSLMASWKQTRWEQKTSNCVLVSLLSLRYGKSW